MSDPTRVVVLGAYAAKQCPVRIHNDYSPAVPTVAWEVPEEHQARLDAGVAFEHEVFDQLAAVCADAVRIDPTLSAAEAVRATVQHMDEGAPVIMGAHLPHDRIGGRWGRPDLLVRFGDGYVPGDVKNHKTLESSTGSCFGSSLSAPSEQIALAGWSAVTNYLRDDGIQLAHYTRMLQASGHHAGPDHLLGAVVGTTMLGIDIDGDEASIVLLWHALDEPTISTFSRGAGKKKRSLLELYDHEHRLRLEVAKRALTITGDFDDPEPLVMPIGQAECETCPYHDHCVALVGEDDPSFAITIGRLDRREWLALRDRGVDTTSALADLDIFDDAWFLPYAAEVKHHSEVAARRRLAAAVGRAGMIRDGVMHYKISDGPVYVPTADFEVDVDIENDLNHRVYMWGVRTRRGSDESTKSYIDTFTEWDPMTEESERALAQRFVDWVREQRDVVESAGETMLVFHWSHPEWSKLHRILGEEAVADLTGQYGIFCDMRRVFKNQFHSLRGTEAYSAS